MTLCLTLGFAYHSPDTNYNHLLLHLVLPPSFIPVQLHIDQNSTVEEAPTKTEEDFFADCEQDDKNSQLNSGVFFGGDFAESGKPTTVTKVSVCLLLR